MPASLPPSKVLVTGANGFIAIWVVKLLLERGYIVRGTSRSEDKNAHLREVFASYVKEGKLELVVVEDITKVSGRTGQMVLDRDEGADLRMGHSLAHSTRR